MDNLLREIQRSCTKVHVWVNGADEPFITGTIGDVSDGVVEIERPGGSFFISIAHLVAVREVPA